MIIGLVGRAQSGKSTAAKYLIKEYGFIQTAFAEPLKQMILKAGMATHEELYHKKTEMSRWLMKKIGTEIFREQVDPDYWIKAMQYHLDLTIKENPSKKIIIDDIRFPNEAKLLMDCYNCTLIRIERINNDGSYFIDSDAGEIHKSESQIDSIPVNQIIIARSGEIEKIQDGINSIYKLINGVLKNRIKERNMYKLIISDGLKNIDMIASLPEYFEKDEISDNITKIIAESEFANRISVHISHGTKEIFIKELFNG